MTKSHTKIKHLLGALYGSRQETNVDEVCVSLLNAIGLESPNSEREVADTTLWSESDIALITYGDSILCEDEKPLSVLHRFCLTHFSDCVTWVHILPFFPWTSDDGFSVLDYSTVNQALGDWDDVRAIGSDFKLMADLVLNHCSSRSVWFENFKRDVAPGA